MLDKIMQIMLNKCSDIRTKCFRKVNLTNMGWRNFDKTAHFEFMHCLHSL